MTTSTQSSSELRAPLGLGHLQLPALQLVRTPAIIFRITRMLLLSCLLTPLLLLLPWQQTITSAGKLAAYDPVYRQQLVRAPVDGRIMEWKVVEGSHVRKGDLLVSIRDPDPHFVSNLERERQSILERMERAKQRVEALQRQQEALERARDQAIQAAEKRRAMGERRLESARQAKISAEASLKLARFQFEVQQGLSKKGLTSQVEYEMARQKLVGAEADLERAVQALEAANSEVEALHADLGKVRNDAEAAIQSVEATQQASNAEVASTQRELARITVRLSRQATQDVLAPGDGWVFRILANAQNGGLFIKQNDDLMILVPEVPAGSERMVELYVEGNDMPLITEFMRDKEEQEVRVRLQFEGWPAVQIMGWPSLALGTFGGRVRMVDRSDDGKGGFRILVTPDPDEEAVNPWPPDQYLRQGVRANGWVFLNRVTIGYELWRRLNGFPPVLASQGTGKSGRGGK